MRGALVLAAVALVVAARASADGVAPPVVVAAPVITGNAVLGGTLTTDGGTFSSSVPVARTYSWQACDAQGANCAAIQYETGATYVPKFFQVKGGATVRAVVTAWNIAGPASATSAPVTIRGATAVVVAAPVISGDARVGGTLTVSDGSWFSVEPWHLTRQWLRCWPDVPTSCTVIPYGLGATLLVGPLDAGWLVEAQVTATTPTGATAVITTPVLIPGPRPAHITALDSDLGVFTLGHKYDITLWSGGVAPYTATGWGNPPAGMTLNAQGHLVGRPSTLQESRFGRDVTDAGGSVARDLEFDYRVIPQYAATHGFANIARTVFGAAPSAGPCALSGTALPAAPSLTGENDSWDLRVGSFARFALVQFGTQPYVFCTLAGTLPPGLKLSQATGVISGKPTKAGGYTVTYAIVDAAGHAGPASVTYGFVVKPKPKRVR
jgi:hypothetical protein